MVSHKTQTQCSEYLETCVCGSQPVRVGMNGGTLASSETWGSSPSTMSDSDG